MNNIMFLYKLERVTKSELMENGKFEADTIKNKIQ